MFSPTKRSQSVSCSPTSPSVMEGALEKKNKTFGSSKCYCSLRDGKLFYCEDGAKDKGRQSYVEISQVQSVVEGKARFAFEVITVKRTHVFTAAKQEEREKWIKVLRDAMVVSSRKLSITNSYLCLDEPNSDGEGTATTRNSVVTTTTTPNANGRFSNIGKFASSLLPSSSKTSTLPAGYRSSNPNDAKAERFGPNGGKPGPCSSDRTKPDGTEPDPSSIAVGCGETKTRGLVDRSIVAASAGVVGESDKEDKGVAVSIDPIKKSAPDEEEDDDLVKESHEEGAGAATGEPESDETRPSESVADAKEEEAKKEGEEEEKVELVTMNPNSLYVNGDDMKKFMRNNHDDGLTPVSESSSSGASVSEPAPPALPIERQDKNVPDDDEDDVFPSEERDEVPELTPATSPPAGGLLRRKSSSSSRPDDGGSPAAAAKLELDADFSSDPLPELPHPRLETSWSSSFDEMRSFLSASWKKEEIVMSSHMFDGRPSSAVNSLKHFLDGAK